MNANSKHELNINNWLLRSLLFKMHLFNIRSWNIDNGDDMVCVSEVQLCSIHIIYFALKLQKIQFFYRPLSKLLSQSNKS